MGAGALGFEVDFGYAPNFFENTAGDDDFELRRQQRDDADGKPHGGRAVRRAERLRDPARTPRAASASSRAASRTPDDLFDVDSTDWGLNVGGGVNGFFSDSFGLRGDMRYFRSLQDNEPDDEVDLALGSFSYWRGTVGVVFRF